MADKVSTNLSDQCVHETYYQTINSDKFHLNYRCAKLKHASYVRQIYVRWSWQRPLPSKICSHCAKVGFIPNSHPTAGSKPYI